MFDEVDASYDDGYCEENWYEVVDKCENCKMFVCIRSEEATDKWDRATP